jgi:hypothetical protein
VEQYRALIIVDVIFLAYLVGLDYVERDVDISLFLKTDAIPETLNGQNQWEPGLEHCLCFLEVLSIAG